MSSHAISQTGLALIQQFEGFQAEPAQLPDGNWVVGHGHVRIGEAGPALTRAEAAELLALDLAPVERSVNNAVKTEITQQQFDALVSFANSVGIEAFESSDVLRRVNAGHLIAAACALDAWRKGEVGGELEIIDSLVRRRAAEKALFLADAVVEASPSVFMRAKLDHAAAILGAPVALAAAPKVGSVPVRLPKPAPALRLTEILKSEPSTEVLLLTQIATDEDIANDQDEIVTAHAKPVARSLDRVRDIVNAAAKAEADKPKRKFAVKWPPFNVSRTVENYGLIALLVFGVALIVLGGSTLLGGNGDVVDIAGASALAAPGLAAVAMSSFGLWKGPTPQRVRVRA